MSESPIMDILAKYPPEPEAVISVLQDIQEKFRYLPRDVLTEVSRELNVPLSRVLSLATFYKAFSLKPKGRNAFHVCLGTACHVRGAQLVLEKLERELGLASGETSADLNYSLDAVRCVGCCGLAPVVMVGEEVHGKITQTKVPGLLKKYQK
ncbi:MAG: NAD(P)H-dependent oxidoreductase subunit E [Candidatus Aminicenantes bacterium]|nr:NAD(P)H-dependent oxidoreductase subunit E [Candidatus Aminicenantes bacterium]